MFITPKVNRAALIAIFLTALLVPGRTYAVNSRSEQPVIISISSIGVGAKVEGLGVDRKGKMIAPESAWTVAWFAPGPKPGQVGNVVMYGHLNTTTSKTGVFTRLKSIRVGDMIEVTDAAGTVWKYRVTETAVYPTKNVPLAKLAGPTTMRHLNLYTCAGTWSRLFHNYSHRQVIYSTLVSSTTLSQAQQ